MAWIKLEQRNSWGTVYYAPKGKSLVDGYASSSLRVGLKKRVRVRWPDGSETIENSGVEHHVDHINDMGHEYSVESSYPVITVDYHGVVVIVHLEDVEIWDEDIVSPSLRP